MHSFGDSPCGGDAVTDGDDDLLEAMLMMHTQFFEAALQSDESMFVRRQHLVGVVVLQLVERLEEVAQRVITRLRVKRDVGRDARQHVITREHELVTRLPETQVSGRMTGRPYRREIPARYVGSLAVFEQDVGLHRVDQRPQWHRRCCSDTISASGAPSRRNMVPTRSRRSVGSS